MKFLIMVMFLNLTAMANEVKTECAGMSENREKIIKTVSKKRHQNSSAVRQ